MPTHSSRAKNKQKEHLGEQLALPGFGRLVWFGFLRFSDYLVRFDRHEAGSGGEEVTGVDYRAGTEQLAAGHQARLPDVK